MTHTFIKAVALSFLIAGPVAAQPATYATPQDALEAFVAGLGMSLRNANG